MDELLAHMRGRHRSPTFAGRSPDGVAVGEGDWDDVKVAPDLFRRLLLASRARSDSASREAVDFLAALGSELATLGGKDIVKPSALHMTSGNQAFLETARDLARSLDPAAPPHAKASCPPAQAFREAVFGARDPAGPGWRGEDAFSSLGFDPGREAVYALTAAAPTRTGPRSTRAAVWLAVEGLPLFPCVPRGGRLHTRGFDRRASAFRWPVWDGALTLDGVRTILGLNGWADGPSDVACLRAYGVRAVMQSDRVTIGQGYGQLRPAVRLA